MTDPATSGASQPSEETGAGCLTFHSETGTEGGYWAVQDRAWVHRKGELCFETGVPEGYVCWAENPHNTSGGHASYEGLHTLTDGDSLTIYEPVGATVAWSGVIDLNQHPLFTEDAMGMWIHADQRGLDRETWAQWFFEERPCLLVKKVEADPNAPSRPSGPSVEKGSTVTGDARG